MAKKGNKKAKAIVAEQPEMAARVCPCGCGALLGKKRIFEQGHDARIRGWFVKISEEDKELTSLPPILQRAFPAWLANGAGAFVKAAIVAAMAD